MASIHFMAPYQKRHQTSSMLTMVTQVLPVMTQNKASYQPIPLYSHTVRAGFPSPADDYLEKHLDLNTHLIAHPASTFMVRVSGDSMVNLGIVEGDLLIVDKSVTPVHGNVVIAAINGELTVKCLYQKKGVVKLVAANEAYPALTVTADLEFVIWGVVIHTIHSFKAPCLL